MSNYPNEHAGFPQLIVPKKQQKRAPKKADKEDEIIQKALAMYSRSKISDAEKLRILAGTDEEYCKHLRMILKSRHTVYVHASSIHTVPVPFEVVESRLQQELQKAEHRLALFAKKIQELEKVFLPKQLSKMGNLVVGIGLSDVELDDNSKPLEEGALYLIFGVDNNGELVTTSTGRVKKNGNNLAIEWSVRGREFEAFASPDRAVFDQGKTMVKLPIILDSMGINFYLSQLTEEALKARLYFISKNELERQVSEAQKKLKNQVSLAKSYFTVHLDKNT